MDLLLGHLTFVRLQMGVAAHQKQFGLKILPKDILT